MELIGAIEALQNVGSGQTQGLWTQIGAAIVNFVDKYYDTLERAGKFIVPFVTIASGAVAIQQKWYYAERNLHKRLSSYLARENKRTEAAQALLDEHAIKPSPANAIGYPLFTESRLSELFSNSGVGSCRPSNMHKNLTARATDEVEATLTELASQLSLWDEKKIEYKKRKAHLHLIKGAMAATRAAQRKSMLLPDRPETLAALGEFEAALELDPTDLQALEYMGHMRVRLGEYAGALQDFSRLETKAAGDDLLKARALKFQAEIFLYRPTPSANRASQCLNDALELMPVNADGLEKAELHEMQAIARSRMPNATDSAHRSLTDAETLYQRNNDARGREGLRRVNELRQAIPAAS